MLIEFSKESKWVNHRDHRNTAQLVMDAMYPYSRDRGFYPAQLKHGLETHSVYKLLMADAYSFDDKVSIEITKQKVL